MMRSIIPALIGLVLLSPATGFSTVVQAQVPRPTVFLVFDGVTVIDVQQGHRIPAQRVVIVGNRIRAVVANGRYFDRAALHRLVTDTQAQAIREAV